MKRAHESNNPGDPPPPPRVDRYGGSRRLLLVAAGVLAALALLVVLFNIQWSGAPVVDDDAGRGGSQLSEEIRGVNPPQAISADALRDAREGPPGQGDVAFDRGAAVDVWSEKEQRLIQHYRAELIVPQGEGRIALQRPRAWLFLKPNETMVLEGDSALANEREDGKLESGTISGHVVVRLFTNEASNSPPDPETDTPRLVIHTEEARFDEIRGEIRCDGWVDVQTSEIHFRGEDLTALYSEQDGLQRLMVERSTAPIRIARTAYEGVTPGRDDDADSPPADVGAAPQPGIAPRWSAPSPAFGRNAMVLEQQDPPRRDVGDRAADRRERRGMDSEEADDDWLERRRDRRRGGDGDPTGEADAPRFYRAIFHNDVRIWREGTEELITGDELHLVFSLENQGLRDSVTAIFETPSLFSAPVKRAQEEHALLRRSAPLRLGNAIAVTVVGATAQDPVDDRIIYRIMPPVSEGDVYVDYTGRLVVSPIADVTEHLASTDDSAVRVLGSPVHIDDPSREVHATCGMIEYITSEERLALLTANAHPLHFTSPEIDARGERFDYWLTRAQGQFRGAGNMHLTRTAAASVSEATVDGRAIEVPQDAAEQGADDAADDRPTSFDIEWSSGVELIFLEHDEATGGTAAEGAEERTSRLESATFRGDVFVTEDRFNMQSDTLTVNFDTAVDRDDAISTIDAHGNVIVRDLGERGGYMEGQELHIAFAEVEGESLPRKMIATGNALVRDSAQSIRAQHMDVDLIPAEPAEGDDPDAARRGGSFDRVQIEKFLAIDNVSVQLDNGSTATGDRLEGNAVEGVANLTGDEVVVEGSDNDVNFRSVGTHAMIDRIGENRSRIRLDGPGTANLRNLSSEDARSGEENAIEEEDEEAQAAEAEQPPTPEGDGAAESGEQSQSDPTRDPETVEVTWTRDFMYIEGVDEGSGFIEVRGDVVAESAAPREDNVLRSDRLSIDFAEELSEPVTDAQGRTVQKSERVLRLLIAEGNHAVMESRTWETPQRTGTPRLVHIKGPLIEYNQQTLEATVTGAGELLVVDPRAPDPNVENELAGRGSSVFSWIESMQMFQFVDERYLVRMRGDVEMLHQSARGADHNATLACEELDVTLARREAAERQAGLDFGGSTDIERFEARGDEDNPLITLDAQQKRIVCMQLIYNTQANVAQIIGSDRVPAEVRTERQRIPMRATKMIWDLATDAVTIDRLRGTIPGGGGG